jgi:hypothetical protein
MGHIGRFGRHTSVLGHTCVLCVCTHTLAGMPKNLVTYLKSCHLFAHGFNLAGQLTPQYRDLWLSDTKEDPCEEAEGDRHVGLPRGHISVIASQNFPMAHCCRIDAYQYLMVLGSRLLYLLELKNIRWSVFCVDNCSHDSPPRSL